MFDLGDRFWYLFGFLVMDRYYDLVIDRWLVFVM